MEVGERGLGTWDTQSLTLPFRDPNIRMVALTEARAWANLFLGKSRPEPATSAGI